MSVLKRLLARILREHRGYLLWALALSVLALVIRFPVPYFSKIIIDRVIPTADRPLLHVLILLTFALTLIGVGLEFVNSLLRIQLERRIGTSMAESFFGDLFSLPFTYFDQWRTGDMLARAMEARSAMTSLTGAVSATIISCLQLLIFPAILLYISWELTLLALLVYPLDAWICIKVNRALYRRNMDAARARADYSSRAYEFVSSIKQILALGAEARAQEEIQTLVSRSIEATVHRDRMRYSGTVLSGVVQAAGTFVLLWLGWDWVLTGQLTLGGLIAFTSYAAFLHGPLTSMFELSHQMQNVTVSAQRYYEVVDAVPPKDEEATADLQVVNSLKPIRFHGVSFAYQPDNDILRNLSIEIPSRSITAIVGKNGSGKTTLTNLIPRFYEPTSGHITIGDQDLRSLKIQSLRAQICFIPQNSVLLKGNVEDQMTFGLPTVNQESLERAAETVGMLDFINALPNGFKTVLGEKGVGLSGGQQQRLLLAQALLQEKPIMILDEATSALDSESERSIMQALTKMRGEHTILIISHRPLIREMADHVIELDEL